VALLGGEPVLIVLDILGHVDVHRGPVVLVGIEKEFPRPGIFEGGQLVDVGESIDHPFVLGMDRSSACSTTIGSAGASLDCSFRADSSPNGSSQLNITYSSPLETD